VLTFPILVNRDVAEVPGMVPLRIPMAVSPGAPRVEIGAGRLKGRSLAPPDLVEVDPVDSGWKPVNPHRHFDPVASLVQGDRSHFLAGGIPQRDSPVGHRSALRCRMAACGDEEQGQREGGSHWGFLAVF
jgi:hypothetical protein